MATTDPVIATEDRTVYDEAIGIHRKVFAGQPIPPDLVAAYEKAGADAASSEPVAAADRAEPPPADPSREPPAEPELPDLGDIHRTSLDAIAARLGVQEPDKLQNKGAVVDAINEYPDGDVAEAVKAVTSAS